MVTAAPANDGTDSSYPWLSGTYTYRKAGEHYSAPSARPTAG